MKTSSTGSILLFVALVATSTLPGVAAMRAPDWGDYIPTPPTPTSIVGLVTGIVQNPTNPPGVPMPQPCAGLGCVYVPDPDLPPVPSAGEIACVWSVFVCGTSLPAPPLPTPPSPQLPCTFGRTYCTPGGADPCANDRCNVPCLDVMECVEPVRESAETVMDRSIDGVPGAGVPSDVCVGSAEPARWCLSDPVPGDQGGEMCIGVVGPAVAITPKMGGASWYRLYKDVSSNLYVSYYLAPEAMNNGPDYWVFGMELYDSNGQPTMHVGPIEYRSRECMLVQTVGLGAASSYYIDAGAVGVVGEQTCSVTFSWEASVGVTFAPDGMSYEQRATLGGSVSCGSGIMVDSESLIRTLGDLGPA